ncbi:MAG TPA: hypothetical protein VGS58_00985, partial [Candidatus Sulfopaludibacter sp.]|nr:hypothetical protein [Candidatus Sulfopaludibacter sp.]
LPKARLWDECTRTPPEERPASLDAIARHLEPRSSRRYWIAAAAIASAGAASYALRGPVRGGINVAAGARILVNGFRAAAAHVPGARLARSLILTALRQSPRIHAIADEDLLPALRRLDPGGTLPIAGRVLQDLMRRLNAAFWIEGDLRQVAGRYSLDLRLQAASGQQGMEATFRDEPSAVALAQTAAGWVRRAAGESGRSLEVNPAEVGRYTSEVPEALQKYYDAMEHYALAEMDLAVPLLEEAVRLDPNFAQAHHMLGLTVDSAGEYDRGFREIELAMRLAQRLPERERTSVEASYYRMVQDPVKMIAAARQNLLYHPDEPRALAAMGERLVYIGKAAEANSGEDAVSFHRRAVALAPDDWMQVLRLDYALIEGGRFPEAVQEFQVAQGRGMANAWLYNPLGYSYMGLERYEEALEAFGKEPVDGDSACDIPAARLMQGHFEPAIAAFEELRAKAKNPIDAHHANEFLCGLYFVTDRPERARRQVRELADLPAYPPMACYLACSASLARRLNDDETLAEVHDLTSQIAGRWQNDYTQAIEMHARALQLWRRNQLDEAEQLLQQSDGKSVNIWTLFDLAELYTRRGKYELAEEYWKKFEARRGTVLVQRWFSGLIVMGWLYHASAAQALQHRETAFQYAKKVLDHWLPNNAGLRIVQAAQNIHAVSKPI